MRKHTPIDGPEFLDQYADRLEANGLTLEAAQIRGVEQQWRQERADHQVLADQATLMNRQLDNARKAIGQAPSTH
jgi:hypothetical protein